MKSTERLGLALPEPSDYVNIEALNENFRRLDALTKDDIGLGDVPNVATNDQTPTYSDTTTLSTLESGEKLSVAFQKIKCAITNLVNHLNNKSNPHGVTAEQVGAVPTTRTVNGKKLSSDITLAAADVGGAVTATYTATVTTSWTASGDYYYQDITVSGILATDTPIVDIVCGSDNAANKVYSENICKVFRVTTSANKIRVWATEAISTAFPIQLKVVR